LNTYSNIVNNVLQGVELLHVYKGFGGMDLIMVLSIPFMLFISACFSAAEVAMFSLGPRELDKMSREHPKASARINSLLNKPKMLLATLLIGINLVNIAIIITSTIIINNVFDFSSFPILGFSIQVIAVTFIILLIAEVIPKVYSNYKPVKVAKALYKGIIVSEKLFYPFSSLLLFTSLLTERLAKKKTNSLSVEELSKALDLTTDTATPETEKKLLRGIVRFGKLDVKQIMKPRPDVVGVDVNLTMKELHEFILNSGYSRMPVFGESMDKVVGVLYIKDLIGHLEQASDFNWRKLMREPFFVPENKMIDDLLREFQGKKIHLAIVVDEYGGTSGIVTLEDIIEEIVGEINDEFDVEDLVYSKLDDRNYVFEGRVQLNDLCRILDLESDIFENSKGESDTLAGFIIEFTGRIPAKNEEVRFKEIVFAIESADQRKIKRIKVTLPQK